MFARMAAVIVVAVVVAGCSGDSGEEGCDGDFDIHNSIDLASFIDARCEEVTGTLGIHNIRGLTSISLPALESVGGDQLIRNNAALCQSIVDRIVGRVDVQGQVDVSGNRDGC